MSSSRRGSVVPGLKKGGADLSKRKSPGRPDAEGPGRGEFPADDRQTRRRGLRNCRSLRKKVI